MTDRLLNKDSNVINVNWIINSLQLSIYDGFSWRTSAVLMIILAAVELCIFMGIAH